METNTSKGVIFISPGPSTTEKAKEITGFGTVTDIVAPNLFHHMNLKKALRLFPNATLWGVKGFDTKRPDLNWQKTFGVDQWPYQEELQAIFVEGTPKINEVVFFHKKSKALIVTDLCFNMIDVKGFGAWLILNIFGTYKKLGTSRFFLFFAKDKNAFKKSIQNILALDFDKIVVSHGEVVTENAKEKLTQIFQEKNLL